jgi:nucleoside-diphosphate-sugar epimerase
VEKVIHVSTIGVYGLLTKVPAAEDHPQRPLRPYAVSKLEAERKVWEYHRAYGMKTVVLRPTAIVGERDRHITGRIIDLTRKTLIPLVKEGKALMSFVHAGDVASALILAGKSEQANGSVYNVQGFSATLKHVLEFFIEELGSKARIVPVPYSMAYVGALLVDMFYATAGRSKPPICARKGLQQLTRDMTFDTTRIRRDLAFEPRYGMDESFQQAIRRQLEQGY